ncbi:hypothetical protein FE257_001766 [Aspergillus nanangensis]|uniref:Uncharacterized protein n=1 Tax=Aspergillus nanangensis TaxID=2582783 RepID=A0AAD4CDG4_ASPNN|nr:hypothetical protein FE257_001766 [Aspergillus nanangensis]
MPPAASDDLFRQQSRSLGDNAPLTDDPNKSIPEDDHGGKSKKKKSGSKAKAKAAKAAAKSPPEELIEASPPSQIEPSSLPNPPLKSQETTNIVSPVLDALGSLGETPENDLTYRTDNWAKSIPFGKSPPNDVGVGEIPSGSPFGFLTTAEKGGFSHPSSASPPPQTRPLSYGTGYISSSASRQQSVDRQKSHSLSSPFNSNIPLPHRPQPHFYGAPDIDIPAFTNQNRSSTDESYSFCAFDVISSPSFKTSRMAGTVLLVGTDGGLEVFAIEDRKSRSVGKLTGLNGRVIEAKLLPNSSLDDPFSSSRPHVAVTVHGPLGSYDDEGGHASSAGSETNEIPGVPTGRHSSAEKRSNKEDARFVNANGPIFALKGRWLAIVPPSSDYRNSLGGSVPASLVQGKVFGIDSRSPPTRPAVNCVTDVGEGESLFDKVARGVTQELVRGARWMGDQGLQAWNSYWNKDQPQNAAQRRPTPMDFTLPGYNMFPPTHAQDTQNATPTEPDLVSILDLKRLEDGGEMKNALVNPVATFQVPNGCSFLSFSPNGLMLLTASKKGDVQYVWDLLQAKYCRAGALMSEDPATPCANVRQVARYARLTTSHIVDVIWYPPSGDRLAIITRKGTVHVFDLPRTAFQWPPFRRARPAPRKSPTRELAGDELTDNTTGAGSLSAAFKLVGDKTQPIFAAVRSRTPSAGAAFPPVSGFAIPSAAGVRGGKVVAAGLSKSMGAAATGTVNTLRHVGENRLHLAGLGRDPAAARVTWVSIKGQPFLGLVDGGFFRLYRIRRSLSAQKNRQFLSVIGGKEIEFRLPPHLQSPCGAMPVGAYNPEITTSATLALPTSNLRPLPASKLKCQPLSQAEIETNAPFQPFHTDQRVNLFIYGGGSSDMVDSETNPTGPWVFGTNIATSKLHVRPFSSPSGNDEDDDVVHEQYSGFGGEMENLISLGSTSGHAEEVVITTRRKKKRSSPYPPVSGAEDGFFEDDCEVLDFARDRV